MLWRKADIRIMIHRRDFPEGQTARKLFRLCCAVLLAATLLTPSWAAAGTVTGKVVRLQTRASDGLQIMTVAGALSGRPACASRYDYFIIHDEKSDTGKTQYAMLMAAYLGDIIVTIDGANTCTRWGDGEDVEAVSYFR